MGNIQGRKLKIGNRKVEIVKQLGEGGYSFVFLVKEVGTGNLYALKRMLVSGETEVENILHEVNLMKNLPPHKNIVKFIDEATIKAGSKQGTQSEFDEIYILMEYCPGQELVQQLTELLQQGKRFSQSRVLAIFSDVCEAVAHLHNQNPPIAHRDLKVENVLVMEDGTCKVCDFGSATTVVMTPNTQKEISWVEDNIQKYTTVPYRAPEMLDLYGHKTINHKVDVWALGCLLYKLMFLETPFEENSQLQILNVNYTIPEDSPYTKTLHSLIKFILNPDPDKRPEIFEVLSCVSKLRGVECPVVKIAHEKVIEPPSLASTMNEDFLSLSDDDDHLLFPTAAALKQQQQQRKQSASSSSSNDNNGFSGKRTHKVKRASTEFVGKSSGSKSKKTSGSSSSSNGPSPSASPRRREKKPSAHHKQKRKEGLKMSSTLPMSASSPENSLSSSPNNNSPEVNSTLFSMLDWHENNNTRPSTMASSAAVGEASTSTTLPQIQVTPSSPIVTSASAPSASPPSSPSKKTPSRHHRKKKEDGGGSSEVAASPAAKETRGEKSKGEGKEGEEREAIPSSASSSALRKSGKKHNIFKLKEHGGNLFKHKHKNKDKDQQQTKDKDGNETPSSSKEEKKSKRRSLTMALKKGKGLTFIVDDDSAHAELPPSLSAPPTPEPSALKGKKKKHLSSSTKQKNAATPVATPTKKKKKENKRDKEDNNRTSPDETTSSSAETVTTPSKSSSSSSSSSTDKRQHSKGSSRRFSVDSPQSKEMIEARSSGERARRQLQYSVPAGKRSLERERRANQRGSKEASPSSSSSPSPSASAEVATKSSSSPATPRSASNLADAPLSASSPSLPSSSASASADITANNVDVSQTAATPPSTSESSSPSLPSSTTGEQQPQQSSQPSVVEQYCLCLAEATTPQTLHMDMQQLQNAITLSWTIQGSISTLDIVSRLTLGHSLVYFKSLAVLHVLMSEGHPSILAEASNNIQYFTNLNTHFLNHQQQGITTSSRIIGEYAVYIIKKLQFHSLHPQYEGNYSLDTFFVSMLSAGMSFSVGDGTPVSKEVAAQALDLLSDITTLGDLIFKGGESPSSFISCIVPLLQEAYSLFLISTYIFSKLIYAEQMYALKPLITYYQQLFKNLRKFYKRAATLSLPFTMPSLPETVPVFSPHQPIRIRPPVTNIHETKLKADQLKEQALLAQQHQQLLQQQQYLTLQQQQMEAAFAALSNDTSSSPSSPSFDSASMPRPSFPSPSLSSASSSSENNKIEAQKDGNKPAKSSTLLATTFHRNQLPPSVSSSSSLQEAEEGEIDPNEFFPEDVPFGATPRFPDDEKEVEDKEDDKNKEVVNNNKEEDLNNINDKHSKKKSTKKKKKSTTKSKQPQEATTGDESKSDK